MFSCFYPQKARDSAQIHAEHLFRALKAQNAARLLAAAHPGLSLDLGSRGWGVTQDLLIFAFLAIFGVFSLTREHPKSRD